MVLEVRSDPPSLYVPFTNMYWFPNLLPQDADAYVLLPLFVFLVLQAAVAVTCLVTGRSNVSKRTRKLLRSASSTKASTGGDKVANDQIYMDEAANLSDDEDGLFDTGGWDKLSDKKSVRQVVKQLGLKGAVEPADEEAYDNTMDEWEYLCTSFGYRHETLKYVLIAMASEALRTYIRDYCDTKDTWTEFRDNLAKGRYPRSRQLRAVKKRIDNGKRELTTEAAIRTLETDVRRYRLLFRRHSRVFGLTEYDMKMALVDRLPEDLAEEVLTRDWFETANFREFRRKTRELSDSMELADETQGRRELEDAAHVFPVITGVCTNCQACDHTLKDCKVEEPVPCMHCGRIGHNQLNCVAIDRTEDGSKKIILIATLRSAMSSCSIAIVRILGLSVCRGSFCM